ncbi:hypothetical protein B0H21DRAFT_541201 [Amylocystis lapponica]|nr:hypothetical protein B0H21DRAFT_541201 [Amylocystis lapponica]
MSRSGCPRPTGSGWAHFQESTAWLPHATNPTKRQMLVGQPGAYSKAHRCSQVLINDMNLISLNEDVIAEIVSHLCTKSALRLSESARILRSVALRHVLSAVRLDKDHYRTTAFCRFVLDDTEGRVRWLRDIEVHPEALTSPVLGWSIHTPTVKLVVLVLERAFNLRRLHIDCTVFERPERMKKALAAPSQLVEIGILLSEYSLLATINGIMPTCLSTLVLEYQTSQGEHPAFFTYISPFRSLHTLRLKHFIQDEHLGRSDIAPQVLLPSMRHLHISSSSTPMSPFVHAFPNLRILCLDRVWLPDDASEPEMDAEECWPTLLDVFGILPCCDGHWHVTCPVHTLGFVHGEEDHRDLGDDAVVSLLYAIQCASPVALNMILRWTLETDFWAELAESVPRLRTWSSTGTQSRRSWCVGFPATPCVAVADVRQDEVPEELAMLGLVAVEIRTSDGDEFVTVRSMGADMDRLPFALAEYMPTLQYIALTWDGHRDLSTTHSWWQVVVVDGVRTPRRILQAVWDRVYVFLHSVEFEDMLSLDGLDLS